MVQSIQLFPGVTLRCFRDNRFKHSCLSLGLVRPMNKEEAALNALLPAVLLRGTEACPDLRDITLRLDDLYGASVGSMVRRVGDYQVTGLYCSFMEDRFALDGDAVLAPMLMFLKELLLQPVLEKGVFKKSFVDSEKKNLIAAIESQKNDKRAYAASQLLKAMCGDDSYSIPRLGEAQWVSAITPEGLYAHYRRLLAESPVDLFYAGSAAPEQVAGLLKPLFEDIERNYVSLPAQAPFQGPGEGGTQLETMEVAQGKLCMGFISPITIRTSQFAAMQVCNTLFGAGMTSKLFMQVRERLSLCYDIGSAYYGSKGILTVSAGIDCNLDTLVQQEVLAQLAACCRGEITGEELTAAKEALLSSLRSTHDSPSAIESYYATAARSGLDMTPTAYMEAVEAVTRQQVMEAAQSLRLHTVYFLKGVQA